MGQAARGKKGCANVLLVLIDDAGFGASSTFGGLAQTPNLDKLATSGVRYNRFHTAGICSPTRAVLLSSLCVRNFLPVALSIFDCLKWQSLLQFQTQMCVVVAEREDKRQSVARQN